MENIIAWAYMVDLDDGLTPNQLDRLNEFIPDTINIIPFDNDEYLETSSVAIGFINASHYDELNDVKTKLAEVCNDFDNERDDFTYTTNNGHKVIMLHDVSVMKFKNWR